jgi:beta-glucosidase
MKNIVTFTATVLLSSSMASAAIPSTKAEQEKMDKFITELMSRMTLDEKLGQLNLPPSDDIVTGQTINSNIGAAVARGQVGGTFNIKGAEKIRDLQKIAVEKSRLGIPLLIGMDVIHGYETVFPIPLGLSCTWDMDAVEKSARVAASEMSAGGICWTFSPMVDISRDPRWGRMSEGSGEDPYLGSEIARAMVRGYQGKDLGAADNVMACVKHFALYGAAEAGRDYNTVDMSRYRMYNEYFEPYKAAVDAGAGSVMSSFNLVDGIPATENKWLLDDVLRKQWNFDGFVVTDYGSIGEVAVHGLEDLPEASVRTLKAGTDMDMCAFGFIGTLKKSLEEGKVSMDDIDKAVRRILEAKYKLGLFENPYKYNDVAREKKDIYTAANRAVARAIAAKSFVLLKNEGNILPLAKKGKIALIGPMGNSAVNMPGTWSVAADARKYKSLRQGFEDALKGKAEVVYAKGSNLYEDPALEAACTVFGHDMRDPRTEQELLDEALRVAADADVIVAAMGEASESAGESSSRTDLTLPATQRRLLEALLATGKPVVMLNFSGRPTVMTWESENVPAILNVWFGGSEAADAIADVVFGDVNPSGKLTVSMPVNVGQVPIYYNHMNTGRPKNPADPSFQKYRSNYIDAPNEPLYPFGYGLSYTTYDYSDFHLDKTAMNRDGSVTASVKVTNTGDREGNETVQFYIRDVRGSVARPVKELKHFETVNLKPGESKTVDFRITPDMLKFYDYNLDYVAEPGEFQVMAGPDSRNVTTLSFTLN